MSYPYYRFFPGDYLRDTRRLTILQHGAYHLLIHEYMTAGKPLHGNLDAMCRVCGALSGEERKAVEFVLAEFFTMDGPNWRHKRCDGELAELSGRSAAASESAKKRWNANAMRTHSEGNANQNQNQIKSKARSKTKPSAEMPPDLAVPSDLWQQFRENRRSLKAPMTAHAENLLARKLRALVAAGQNGVGVVEQSIERGWKGLFAVDVQQTKAKTQAEKRAVVNTAIWGNRSKDDDAIDGTIID